jgi:hypothetical protein
MSFSARPLRHFRRLSKAHLFAFLMAGALLLSLMATPARAQQAVPEEQQQLFQRMLDNPRDLDVTFAYVRVATARGDYEAAIGALERVLFYHPGLARVKYELGSLYFRLRAYDMARRYFKEALESPDLDPVTRDRVETALPDAEKQSQQSRLSGFVATGLRYQTNASFAPTSGTVRLGGIDLALLPSATRKADTNWFGLAGVSHDYDLDNQRGDVLETRFVGYVTEQQRFNSLNVGLFDLSFGPRVALAPELLPGVTIKPYVVGGNTWIGGNSYLATGGAGVSAQIPFADRFSISPEFEWRRADVNSGDIIPVSTLSSGNWYSAGLSASAELAPQIRLDARGLYRRADAQFTFQAYNQWVGEAALSFAFAPPFGMVSRNWSIAPFVRLISTQFDAANPFIDPATVRRDNEWIAGVVFDTPLTRTFGLSTIVQYDKVGSTLPNFRQDNLSVMFGPTARF